MRQILSLLFGLLVLVGSSPLVAQPAPNPPSPPTEEERSKLVQEILTAGEDADAEDLAWLYSRADEYTPSPEADRGAARAPGLSLRAFVEQRRDFLLKHPDLQGL